MDGFVHSSKLAKLNLDAHKCAKNVSDFGLSFIMNVQNRKIGCSDFRHPKVQSIHLRKFKKRTV